MTRQENKVTDNGYMFQQRCFVCILVLAIPFQLCGCDGNAKKTIHEEWKVPEVIDPVDPFPEPSSISSLSICLYVSSEIPEEIVVDPVPTKLTRLVLSTLLPAQIVSSDTSSPMPSLTGVGKIGVTCNNGSIHTIHVLMDDREGTAVFMLDGEHYAGGNVQRYLTVARKLIQNEKAHETVQGKTAPPR